MIDINKLARSGMVKRYNTDEVFFHQGDTGSQMYIILSGRVNVFISSVDDVQFKVSELGPGDFFGEMSLLEDLPRSATIQAAETTTVLVIDKDNFDSVIASQPGLAFRIMKGISSRLRQQNEEIKHTVKARQAPQAEVRPQSTAAEDLKDAVQAPEPVPLADQGPLFPPGHKNYLRKAPAGHETYLFDKNVTCPVCKSTFNVTMVRSSRLKLQHVEPDFRQRFVDFEPLWYLIHSCPECYYSNLSSDFAQVPDRFTAQIRESNALIKQKYPSFTFTSPREIDQVFFSYYLALNYYEVTQAKPAKKANLWLRLAWLYEDVKDQDMYMYAVDKALEFFKESYFKSTEQFSSPEAEQRLGIILGELSLVKGNYNDAVKFFRGSIVRRGGNHNLNRQAQDRLLEVKQKVASSEEQESTTN